MEQIGYFLALLSGGKAGRTLEGSKTSLEIWRISLPLYPLSICFVMVCKQGVYM